MKKLFIQFLFAAAVLTSSQTLFAQVTTPPKQWDKTFGGSQYDDLKCIKQTTDGGYILGGSSGSPISGDKTLGPIGSSDFWVIKVDASGIKQWEKVFGGNDQDVFYSLQQTSDGGYILAGTSISGISGSKTQPSKGGDDYWIVKIDANGNKQWDKTIGSSSPDYLKVVKQTSDGGYILGGFTTGGITGDKTQASKGSFDFWVVKLDGNGSIVWDKTLGSYNGEQLFDIGLSVDGGYILGGFSGSDMGGDKSQDGEGASDFWVVKLSSTGVKQWDKTFGGIDSDELASLMQTSDGGFILGGTTQLGIGGTKNTSSKGMHDFWVIKINSLGIKQWERTIGGNHIEEFYSLQQTSDGGFILGGNSGSTISGDKTEVHFGSGDYWVVKLNSLGDVSWDLTLGGNLLDVIHSLQQTADGGYILGGQSVSGVNSFKSQPSRGWGDYWIVKLGPEVLGVKDLQEDKINFFPNPTSGIISLQLGNIKPSQVRAFNSIGQLVLIKNLGKTDKEEQIQIDLSKEPKGFYTIQVLSGNQIITKKVVLQ